MDIEDGLIGPRKCVVDVEVAKNICHPIVSKLCADQLAYNQDTLSLHLTDCLLWEETCIGLDGRKARLRQGAVRGPPRLLIDVEI